MELDDHNDSPNFSSGMMNRQVFTYQIMKNIDSKRFHVYSIWRWIKHRFVGGYINFIRWIFMVLSVVWRYPRTARTLIRSRSYIWIKRSNLPRSEDFWQDKIIFFVISGTKYNYGTATVNKKIGKESFRGCKIRILDFYLKRIKVKYFQFN